MFSQVLLIALLALSQCSDVVAGGKKKSRKARSLVAEIGPYPGSGSDVGGTVKMTFDEKSGKVIIACDLHDAEENCSTSNTVANGCGVHIHEGLTCNTMTMVGGHFWNTATLDNDPWANIRYTSDGSGNVDDTIKMQGGDGYGKDINFARAVVIHDKTGSRIGCGLLE
mmetsp:Transcript_57392/g.171194  ORF Transcript_57392/g.171194 Transcript_57392/m.171194 type:complete len:168 (-) Transcript_57392:628-1131(-)